MLTVTPTRVDIDGDPPEDVRLALCDWCLHHGINPDSVPIGCYIERRPGARQVGYTRVVLNDQGHPCVDQNDQVVTTDAFQQLEAEPLPWPAEVAAWSERR